MKEIIPPQQTGRAIDAKSSREFDNIRQAVEFFQLAKQRLQNVSSWHTIAGEGLAEFTLVDAQGHSVNRPPLKNDHFKIDIPGPGSKQGDGYDWVRIETVDEDISDDVEIYGFTVRPASNPMKPDHETAHFYADVSTSTFIVKRHGHRVSAEIHDRNTKVNDEADRAVDKVRHAVVGAGGLLAFSKIQWQSLADGLIANTN